ncbi:dynein axonemal intermediate chain 7 isoform X2 [Hippopotamus amphibius kiboko]|uniref:dynein axonemal intermediate chain 7 isoform X2 n=1 Tax=Hippopotamus amphibius kiboko TaxID=575201 RepID=UPI002596C205|nr:dynein axonemal intermediate chain 7 isoform X2 [Hippopotamus amphibius kiboko]
MSGSKKKRITKADRLKQLQEEEEKRQKEEEEARVKYEKEEMERLEIQRIEKEKLRKLEAKDLERRNEELEELYLLEARFPEAEKLKRDSRLLSQWKHYIQCDGSPDPSISQEINTFISLWKEETNETFEAVISKSKLVLNLIEKLKLILLETPPYDLQEKNIIQYQGSILELQELLHLKFSIATEILLRQASTLADLDSGNMEIIIRDENVTLYVWANLKKNPRYRSIRFSDTQIGFEIPRILATSDIALRLLHTHYDHVTPLRPVPTASQEDTSTVTYFIKDELKSVEAAVSKDLQEEYKQQENESNSVHEEEKKVEEQGDIEGQTCSVQEEPEATKYELEMKLLSETVSAAQLLLLENAREKPYFFEENEVDLCQFTTLGGVYHLDILELPPKCKPMKGWMIVEIHKEGLQKYTYPPETTEDFETENVFPPIEVMLEVHENVIFFENPMVARWDAEEGKMELMSRSSQLKGKHWKTDGISNVSYKSEDRLITFSLETFGPVTLLQDAHVNMPYQSWALRPLGVNKVLLTVTTVFTEIQIQIKENLCMLASIKLNNKKHSSILEEKWMTPASFILALKETGLNIFPTGHSHFYVVINYKFPPVEVKAYRQMALLSSAFAFGWSKWNIVCDSKKVVFQVREHLPEEEPIQNPHWTLLMFSGDRAQSLKINESSDAFSEALKEETEFHSTLYHMVKDFASKEAMKKVRHSNCQFVDSVCHMLLSTRLLSYS